MLYFKPISLNHSLSLNLQNDPCHMCDLFSVINNKCFSKWQQKFDVLKIRCKCIMVTFFSELK